MPLRAIARTIQNMLYSQRFFPYYVYNILGGIEEDGESISSQFKPPFLSSIDLVLGFFVLWLSSK